MLNFQAEIETKNCLIFLHFKNVKKVLVELNFFEGSYQDIRTVWEGDVGGGRCRVLNIQRKINTQIAKQEGGLRLD